MLEGATRNVGRETMRTGVTSVQQLISLLSYVVQATQLIDQVVERGAAPNFDIKTSMWTDG